jgi:hypothetical protein
MKKVIISLLIATVGLLTGYGQNKKAEKDSIAQVKFEQAVKDIDARDFAIVVDTYGNAYEPNTDNANFLSYEKDFMLLQGQIIAGNSYTNKLEVNDFSQVTDKKGNVKYYLQVKGFYLTAKIEISLRKTSGNYADVIITPTRGEAVRFSGSVEPRSESKYFRRTGEI